MIAVFSRTQRDFDQWHFNEKNFKRVIKVEDVRGQHFSGIMKIDNWYDGGDEMCRAYDELIKRQPELTR